MSTSHTLLLLLLLGAPCRIVRTESRTLRALSFSLVAVAIQDMPPATTRAMHDGRHGKLTWRLGARMFSRHSPSKLTTPPAPLLLPTSQLALVGWLVCLRTLWCDFCIPGLIVKVKVSHSLSQNNSVIVVYFSKYVVLRSK